MRPVRSLLVMAFCVFWLGSGAEQRIPGSAPKPTEALRAVTLSSCTLLGLAQPARCGVLKVPEDTDRPDGRKLAIGVAVVPATGGRPRPDPIAVLMGGPGEDAISAAEVYARQFAPLLQDHDLLLVDQRGTGRSNALHCDLSSSEDPAASLRDLFPLSAVERCARRLRAQTDLTQYTYDRFAHDLEQVRHALRYGPMNLFAGSYGTRAAQVYVRMYPESVRTAYLGSVVPIDVAMPLPFAKAEQTAIEKMLEACAADSKCNAAFPSLREEFRQISAQLGSGPVDVQIPGQGGRAPMYGGRVAEWFRSKLYRPRSSVALPWMIHRASLGDWSPIAEGILSDARAADSGFSFGLFFSITCSEDIAFIREEDVAAETKGTFLGDYRVRQQQAACKLWPKASLPKHYREPVQSSVPTAFGFGDTDGAMQLWFMDHVAQGFSHSRKIVMRGQGHTEWNECVAEIYRRLVVTGSVEGGDTSGCPAIPRPPFKSL